MMESKISPTDLKSAQMYFERKLAFTMGPMEVHHKQEQGEKLIVVDVRSAKDFEKAHIPGAIHLPEDQWESLKGLSKDEINVVYCDSVACHLAARASVFFASRGFSVVEMDGGCEYWQHYKLDEEIRKIPR